MNTVPGSTFQVSGNEQAVKLTPNEEKVLGMIATHLQMARQLVDVLHNDTANIFRERLYAKGVYLMDLDAMKDIANEMVKR